MKYKYILSITVGLLLSGCSSSSDKKKDFINVSSNNSVKLISKTAVEVSKNSTMNIEEICVNGELIVFVEAYKAGGGIKMGDSSKCKIIKKRMKNVK